MQCEVDLLDCEIPEYNCVTGLWGQPEARIAFELTERFCRENGLNPPKRGAAVRYKIKRRIIDRLTVEQRGRTAPVAVTPAFYEGGALGDGLIRSLMDELSAEGALVKTAEGGYRLSDFENYRFDFSS